MLVAFLLQRQVAEPPVGVDDAPWFHRVLHKGHQTLGGRIHNLAHANPADPQPILLSGNNNQCLLYVEPTGQAFLQPTHIAFVYLDSTCQQVAPRSYHRAAQFMQPRPRRLIALQAEHSLQPQRAGTVLLSRHPPHGTKPNWQRGPRVLEDSSGCHPSLPSTSRPLERHTSPPP